MSKYIPSAEIDSLPAVLPKARVIHNHGTAELENARIVALPDFVCMHTGRTYKQVQLVGTCVGGGATSRLFWATSHRPFETGVEMSYNVSGRGFRHTDDDIYEVSVESCG